jgi:hypothetical protein
MSLLSLLEFRRGWVLRASLSALHLDFLGFLRDDSSQRIILLDGLFGAVRQRLIFWQFGDVVLFRFFKDDVVPEVEFLCMSGFIENGIFSTVEIIFEIRWRNVGLSPNWFSFV